MLISFVPRPSISGDLSFEPSEEQVASYVIKPQGGLNHDICRLGLSKGVSRCEGLSALGLSHYCTDSCNTFTESGTSNSTTTDVNYKQFTLLVSNWLS